MRYLYSFLFYSALPFILIRLWLRSRRLPAYRQRLSERFGYYPFTLDHSIWVHAVSVGETIAAIPLIKALQKQFPQEKILITTMTPTGAERVKSALGNTVHHVYLPYDFPGAVRRFLQAMNPRIAIIMETELWPNLIAICKQRNIPVCVVNARLSEESARGYQRVRWLTQSMLQQVTAIVANGQADADRFIALGAPRENMSVSGNIKFDLVLPADLVERGKKLQTELGVERFIWIAASTHEGEEEIILAAHKLVVAQDATALLILVPRHPDRFDSMAKMCEQQFVTQRRSKNERVDVQTQVYLGDTMGELLLLYAVANVTFVAGSLVPRGGHNILEPAALSKPILTGKHLFNFAEISDLFIKANALVQVNDAKELAQQLLEFKNNSNEARLMGERGLQMMEANRGALQRQMKVIVEKMRHSF